MDKPHTAIVIGKMKDEENKFVPILLDCDIMSKYYGNVIINVMVFPFEVFMELLDQFLSLSTQSHFDEELVSNWDKVMHSLYNDYEDKNDVMREVAQFQKLIQLVAKKRRNKVKCFADWLKVHARTYLTSKEEISKYMSKIKEWRSIEDDITFPFLGTTDFHNVGHFWTYNPLNPLPLQHISDFPQQHNGNNLHHDEEEEVDWTNILSGF
jgi:hypothetical protein